MKIQRKERSEDLSIGEACNETIQKKILRHLVQTRTELRGSTRGVCGPTCVPGRARQTVRQNSQGFERLRRISMGPKFEVNCWLVSILRLSRISVKQTDRQTERFIYSKDIECRTLLYREKYRR
uniref:Uncharacterized protein n=1 Tax=Haemonchus contortus TaxID=6289 RepID=A0A7I4YB12_HAECO